MSVKLEEIRAKIAELEASGGQITPTALAPEQVQQINSETQDRIGIESEITQRQNADLVTTAEPQQIPRPATEVPREASDDGGIMQFLDKGIPAPIAELAAAVNRGTLSLADLLTDPIMQGAASAVGAEGDFTGRFKHAAGEGIEGDFMEDGLTKRVIRTGGEFVGPGGAFGAGTRALAKTIPAVQPTIQTATQGVIRSLGQTGAKADISGATLSGAGAEIGREAGGETGALVGAIVTPLAGGGVKQAFSKLLKVGRQGIEALMKPLATMTDDGASTLLAEAMTREGLTEAQVLARLKELGPESIPADLGNNFARLLRTASNKIPRIEGEAATVLKARHAGQGDRLLRALDDATGTGAATVDDAIKGLEVKLGPEIKRLYSESTSKSMQLSPKLNNLLEGKSSVGRAAKKAQQRLTDKRAAGDEISNIDVINATKQEMDDQIGVAIRAGNANKARDLIRLKNIMVAEADSAVPSYKQARDLYAGKAELENAASSGELFLKMKPIDIKSLTNSFGKSEMAFYRLGAKKAIMDKIDDLQTNADAVRRLFGKNGDVKKLRSLFPNDKAFNKFSDTLKRESDFILTRRAAQANSTTAKQLADDESAFETLGSLAMALKGNPAGILGKITGGLGKGKNDAIYIKALEDVGDILLMKGVDPKKIQSILKSGNRKRIEAQLQSAMKRKTLDFYERQALSAGAVEANQ